MSKAYRPKALDERLRRERTRTEARLLVDARRLGVRTPILYDIDLARHRLILEELPGPTLKEILEDPKQTPDLVTVAVRFVRRGARQAPRRRDLPRRPHELERPLPGRSGRTPGVHRPVDGQPEPRCRGAGDRPAPGRGGSAGAPPEGGGSHPRIPRGVRRGEPRRSEGRPPAREGDPRADAVRLVPFTPSAGPARGRPRARRAAPR